MRFRIQADSPLPVTKAWFSCTGNESITDLKKSLCNTIPKFISAKTNSKVKFNTNSPKLRKKGEIL
ncbi:hypothetical protein CPB85DRAFT_643388 [Mucidula mucida]|nr:hypothetical protein CPB85DRAFT_643388 [Mucidula mucida]